MQRLSVDEFHEAAKLPLIVVLDDVRSLHNVGSVFRSGDAFRVEAVYLCGITATPPHPEIHKTALGGEDSVAWRYFPTATEAIESLHNDGFFYTLLRSGISAQICGWIDMLVSFMLFALIHLTPWLSTALGAFTGGIFNCIINYRYAFHAHNKNVSRRAVTVKFLLV